jgi:hypothetical protein
MSFQATRFILGLTDLTPSEKAVAHTLAYHANKLGENSYPSMETIARESGLQSRRSAQRVVRQLEKKRIIVATTAKTGGRGRNKATVYRLDLDYKSAVNSDTTVALSDQQTATPQSLFTAEKQRPREHKSATPATIKRDIQGHKQRRTGRTKSNEESRRVSEEDDQHQSRVKEPPTPFLKTKAHAADEEGIKPNQTPTPQDQTSIPPSSKTTPSPNHPVKSCKSMSAAPDVARLQAEILRIPLSGGRPFQFNSKLQAIVRNELANGRPAALILEAAERIGGTLSDRDRIPGLTLADNLAATIVAIEMEEAEKAHGMENKKTQSRRYELTNSLLIEQEEQAGSEYKSWPGTLVDFTSSDSRAFERYKLRESLKTEHDYNRKFNNEKRLCDLRSEAVESPAILASVEAQLAAEGYCTTPMAQ